MINKIYTKDEITAFESIVSKAKNIVVIGHTMPDGDAIASVLGLTLILRKIYKNKNIDALLPDYIPAYLEWMTDSSEIVIWGDDVSKELIEKADLMIHLDHNQIHRLRHPELKELASRPNLTHILVDHHLYPATDFALIISQPERAATAEMISNLIYELGWEEYLSEKEATLLLTGIITDTGRFLYGYSDANVFDITAKLLQKGADIYRINDMLNYHAPENQFRFQYAVISENLELDYSNKAAYICISKEEQERFNSKKGDTEGFVNIPLGIEGIEVSVLMREENEFIKLSFRSTGDFPANRLAEMFGGGGHLNAAGAEFRGSIDEAKKLYLERVAILWNEIKNNNKI